MSKTALDDIRNQFDDIDKSILILLSTRAQLSKEIAKIKKENNMNVIQLSSWKKHLKKRLKENEKLQLDNNFLNKIFNVIHEESIRIQQQEQGK